MSAFKLLKVGGQMAYTWDFSDDMPESSPATSLTGVTFSVEGSPEPLTVSGQVDNLSAYSSTVVISGATHAGIYVVQALGTLSNGEVIPKDATFVCFNA